MDWSLLGCGASGHVTYAPDQPAALRERLSTTTPDGTAWRCLRCGTFVAGTPGATGPAGEAPRVRRGKELRGAFILRLFAIERWLRAIVFALLASGLWRFSSSKYSLQQAFDRELPILRPLLRQLGINADHSKIIGLIQHAFTIDGRTLVYLAIAAGAYAVIEVIEGTGLWLVKRWGEYFAVIATALGLPYEIYDLISKVTALRVAFFVINLALVIYLLATKRLFGIRGGRPAYQARLRGTSIIAGELAVVAAQTPAAPAGAKPADADSGPAGAPPDHADTTRSGGPARPAGG